MSYVITHKVDPFFVDLGLLGKYKCSVEYREDDRDVQYICLDRVELPWFAIEISYDQLPTFAQSIIDEAVWSDANERRVCNAEFLSDSAREAALFDREEARAINAGMVR